MITEQHITDLAARLKAAHPQRHTALTLAIDNHSSGRTRITYWAYLGSNKTVHRVNVSPDFHSFPELAAWVEKHWL